MTRELLYSLLPEIYRYRDYYEGQSLRALMDVLEDVFESLESGVAAGYENWFIETCETAAIPYLGDLLHADLGAPEDLLASYRGYVGNIIAYRRRKGTAEGLARAAAAATGWDAHVLEYRRQLAAAVDLADPRRSQPGSLNLRTMPPAAINRAYDRSPHNVALRRPRRGTPAVGGGGAIPGQHGIHHVGLFVWRLASLQVNSAEARPIGNGLFTVHPFGIDAPLFTARRGPLERIALARSLQEGRHHDLEVAVQDQPGLPFRRIKAARICSRELSSVTPSAPGWEKIELCVDPERGRLLFPKRQPHAVRVTCYHGFSGNYGGGAYERPVSSTRQAGVWEARVYRDAPAGAPDTFPTLRLALAAWVRRAQRHGVDGLIRILDSGVYQERPPRLDLRNRSLTIEAGHSQRPTLLYGLEVRGGLQGRLALDGLWIGGTVRIGGVMELAVRHCTISPGRAAIEEASGPYAAVSVRASILGRVWLPRASFQAADSILDAGDNGANALAASSVRIENGTVRGEVQAESMELASSTIFLGRVRIRDTAGGCLRYSYFPARSQVPAPYRCLDGAPPAFTSLRYGDAGYCQLALHRAEEFFHAGEDNTEVGVFRGLKQPARWRKLHAVVNEFVPFGFGCQVFYET